VLVICLLTAGMVFFSVNAVALRIFSRARLLEAFKKRRQAAEAENFTDTLARNSERLTLTCSLYRLVLNLCILVLLLALFGAAGKDMSSASDYVILFVAATIIFSLFSLAIPHAWAKYAGETVLSRTHRSLLLFAVVAGPVLLLWKFVDTLVRRLAGVGETTADRLQEEKEEEFLTDLEQQRLDGVVDEEEQQMIENVLELADTTAAEIMTPRTDIVALEVNSGLAAVLETITTAGHSRVPVYEKNIDTIIGLVYAKDLLTEVGKPGDDFKLSDKLREAYFVPESKTLRVLLHEFQNQKLHIAVVLDEYGGTAGIVTLEDILEELVGEIADEYEESPPQPIKQIDEDTVEIDARTNIDDINDQFEFDLPEDEDYDTLGGFVFSHLGYIPKTGDGFQYENLKFTITNAERRRIKRIKIQKKRQE